MTEVHQDGLAQRPIVHRYKSSNIYMTALLQRISAPLQDSALTVECIGGGGSSLRPDHGLCVNTSERILGLAPLANKFRGPYAALSRESQAG